MEFIEIKNIDSQDVSIKKVEFQGIGIGNSSTIIDWELYEGETVVTPNLETQKLLTAGTRLLDDVEVKPIPYAEVSNPSGGKTCIIG